MTTYNFKTYEEYSKSLGTDVLFTKPEMNSEWNVYFLGKPHHSIHLFQCVFYCWSTSKTLFTRQETTYFLFMFSTSSNITVEIHFQCSEQEKVAHSYFLWVCINSNPLSLVECDTMLVFKLNIAGLNSEFAFSETNYQKVKESSLPLLFTFVWTCAFP